MSNNVLKLMLGIGLTLLAMGGIYLHIEYSGWVLAAGLLIIFEAA